MANSHGGKRTGAGRKSITGKKQSNVVRVDDELLRLIKEYKYGNLKALPIQDEGILQQMTFIEKKDDTQLEVIKELQSALEKTKSSAESNLAEVQKKSIALDLAYSEIQGRNNRIDDLDIEIDGLRESVAVVTKLNKTQKGEIEKLKAYGATQVLRDEIAELKQLLKDREKAYSKK